MSLTQGLICVNIIFLHLKLTSPVVARDHYKGKRHKRAEEVWHQENPSKTPTKHNVSHPSNSTFINGIVTPVNQQSSIANQNDMSDRRPPRSTPIANRDSKPFPVPGVKRPHEQRFPNSSNDFIPAYRAALAKPGPSYKKPKKEGTINRTLRS